MPPPNPELFPLAMVSPLRVAPVTPEFTVNTVYAFAPLTVTRLARVAPLPVVGPVTVVFDGMLSAPPDPSVMVWGVANSVELKVTFQVPVPAAAARASRRLQLPPLPLLGPPTGQLAATPLMSSWLVVTTRFCVDTTIPLDMMLRWFAESVAVIVCEPGVRSVPLNVPVPALRVVAAGSVALGSLLVNLTMP